MVPVEGTLPSLKTSAKPPLKRQLFYQGDLPIILYSAPHKIKQKDIDVYIFCIIIKTLFKGVYIITKDQHFTEQQLFQSVDELASVDISPYISEPLMRNIGRGIDSFDLRTIPPIEYSKCIQERYDNISSSARELDKQLEDKGFDTTYKFSYKYNMSPQMHERIVQDEWILGYFQDIYNHPDLPKIELQNNKQFRQIILNALYVTYGYAAGILQYNPGVYNYTNLLENPFKGWYHVLNFVIGVGYGFHPLDIKFHEQVFYNNYYCHQEEYEKQRAFKNWCKEQYGIDAGCLLLSPENMEKLRQILICQNTPKIER